MDDTMWIAPTKDQLQEIVNTATTFFQLTNIQVNPTKSVLATITKQPNPEISFNNTKIKSINTKTCFRFLGCWYTTGKQHIPVYKIIKER